MSELCGGVGEKTGEESLMRIPWGKRIEGKVYIKCKKCGHEWWYTLEEGGEVICEVIGLNCPFCGRVTGNHVLEWDQTIVI